MENKLKENFVVFKVAGSNNVVITADAIVKTLLEGKNIEVQAVGASAVNQAVKSIAVARGKLAVYGKDLYVAPGFGTIKSDEGERTIITMKLRYL